MLARRVRSDSRRVVRAHKRSAIYCTFADTRIVCNRCTGLPGARALSVSRTLRGPRPVRAWPLDMMRGSTHQIPCNVGAHTTTTCITYNVRACVCTYTIRAVRAPSTCLRDLRNIHTLYTHRYILYIHIYTRWSTACWRYGLRNDVIVSSLSMTKTNYNNMTSTTK